MKILILADMDDFHWSQGAGKADVLLSCGDVSDQVILEAAQEYDCKHLFAVKGNHDGNTPFPEPIVDLHLKVRKVENLLFGGMNGSWRYKPRGPFLYEQGEAEALVGTFPYVDVFLSHNSPRGLHDREDGIHHGFAALAAYIDRTRPKYMIHGHQHVEKESLCGDTMVVGVYGHRLLEIEEYAN